MPVSARAIAPGPGFWPQLARVLLAATDSEAEPSAPPLSQWLVMVPTFTHIGALRSALAEELGPDFIPPQIRTLSSWLEQQLPEPGHAGPATPSERLMELYVQLRETGWLKTLLAARRNTDLLPLAQTLLSLNDELSAALLPSALAQPDEVEDRWKAALAQLSPRAATLLSNEAHLVWTLWQGERDARDPGLARHNAMQRAAAAAEFPLLWCAPWEPDALESAFLEAWSQKQPVLRIRVAWSADVLPALYAQSWPEILDDGLADAARPELPQGLKLYPARSMEDEAQAAAQTIVDWVASGKQRIALVPQDRVVARRLRALLERADIVVSDETGWKLSTTRAAAVIHAWMALVSAGGEIAPLLDFLKSPFVRHPALDEPASRHALERALVKLGHSGHWSSVAEAVASLPDVKAMVDAIAREAQAYRTKKSVAEWVAATTQVFDALGCSATLASDKAGEQLLGMLQRLARDCESLDHGFSLAEWRVLLDLELEQTVFVAPRDDRRVMMVPLNGTMLREFDAAIVVGADSEHLPSRPAEALFFANAVRRELGLATREDKQRQQLREFAALLIGCPEVVLSWQQIQDGEKVAASPWIQRLQLTLQMKPGQAGRAELPLHVPQRAVSELTTAVPQQPRPAAPQLLPSTLSASGYAALVNCPYQFFASRMLGLRAADPLRELPEKRDYGDWLHQILKQYHDRLRDTPLPHEQRKALMASISDAVFDTVLAHNPAALPWQARWASRRDSYVDWANKLESEGWSYRHGEHEAGITLSHGEGSLRLFGKLDRIDVNSDGEQRVLDYKTTAKDALKLRLKEHSDHQLPFYSLLLEPQPAGAGYVPVDDEKQELLPAKDIDAWRAALREQLQQNFASIAGGAELVANGSGDSCTYCDMNGLCRKGYW